jgi:DNA replication protein DnaC
MTSAEDLLEIVMRRYEPASTLLTSNRPLVDWGKLLGDSAAVTAMLDRLLHPSITQSQQYSAICLRNKLTVINNQNHIGAHNGQRLAST